MTRKVSTQVLTDEVLDLLSRNDRITVTQTSVALDVADRRIRRILDALEIKKLAHRVSLVNRNVRQYWAAGKAPVPVEVHGESMAEPAPVRSTVWGILVANTERRTVFVGGINPWTGGRMK